MSPLLLESICVREGAIQLLDYHQARVNRSLPSGSHLDLQACLSGVALPPEGVHKLRLVYDLTARVELMELLAYQPRRVRRLHLRDASHIDYRVKWLDRRALDELMHGVPEQDDVLLVKDGYLCEGRYANIALKKEGCWFTPSSCLLQGVQRDFLIDKGILFLTNIKIEDLMAYSELCLINSMLPLGSSTLPIYSIGI